MKVLVISNTKKPLMPCSPSRGRRLLNSKKAAVYRRAPFTIILKDRSEGDVQPVRVKIDPGSKTTGIAVVGEFPKQGNVVLWGANLEHQGQAVKMRLTNRSMLRRGRRGRKTRYRPARWANRSRQPVTYDKWLPPSLRSRLDNTRSIISKLMDRSPVTDFSVEIVRFDMQKIQNPEISGVEYQQGELMGYEVKEYLLEKWGRKCVYCDKENIPLQTEHIVPRASGGTNNVSNLTIACEPCNQRKGNQNVEVFLARKPEKLARLKRQMISTVNLRDAAVVNASRWSLANYLQDTYGLPVEHGSGGRTKFNRANQSIDKDHWKDASCVGESGSSVSIPESFKVLTIKSRGRGNRQMRQVDRYGFPKGRPKAIKRLHGIQTGDIVRLNQPSGKYQGTYVSRLTSIKSESERGTIKVNGKEIVSNWSNFTRLQCIDGYEYSYG